MKHVIPITIAITIMSLNGCEKSETSVNNSDENSVGYKVKNGIIVFRDQNALKSVMQEISTMSPNEYCKWAEKIGFTSMQGLYEKVIQAEAELDLGVDRLYQNGQPINPEKIDHSSLYYNSLKTGIIRKIIDKDDNSEYYEMNTSFPAMATILSPGGVYMLGDTIVYCGRDTLKYWINGDINNLQNLKSNKNIPGEFEIWTLCSTIKKSTLNPNPDWSGWTESGIRRLSIYLYFQTWQYTGDGKVWKYNHYINVKSQKKNLWGTWKYNQTDMYIKGSWDGKVTYQDPVYLNTLYEYYGAVFHPSYYPGYYHNFASDLYCSISIFDGTISPYPTEWQVTYTSGGQLARIYDISIDTYNWEAIGHVDVKATLP